MSEQDPPGGGFGPPAGAGGFGPPAESAPDAFGPPAAAPPAPGFGPPQGAPAPGFGPPPGAQPPGAQPPGAGGFGPPPGAQPAPGFGPPPGAQQPPGAGGFGPPPGAPGGPQGGGFGPPPGAPGGPQGGGAPATDPLAIASLAVGMVGLLTCACCSIFGLPLQLAGIGLGIFSYLRIEKEPDRYGGRALAIAGIAVNGTAIALAMLGLILGMGGPILEAITRGL